VLTVDPAPRVAAADHEDVPDVGLRAALALDLADPDAERLPPGRLREQPALEWNNSSRTISAPRPALEVQLTPPEDLLETRAVAHRAEALEG
jgi:hypothetical protein